MAVPKTDKQKIIEMFERLPADIDFNRAIEAVVVLPRIEQALSDADAAPGTEHEEFMRELLAEDEEVSRHLDAAS